MNDGTKVFTCERYKFPEVLAEIRHSVDSTSDDHPHSHPNCTMDIATPGGIIHLQYDSFSGEFGTDQVWFTLSPPANDAISNAILEAS